MSNGTVEGLVSTIIPVYNRAPLLREAVRSVLSQTYRPIEILIVNDGSTDETARVADELTSEHPHEIRVIHQVNSGAGLAREAGRQVACGEFIQYLDSDDVLLPEKFRKQVDGLRANPECGVSYGKTRFCRLGDSAPDLAWKRTGEEISTMFPPFIQSRLWGTSTPLYRRQLTDLAGPWTNLRNEEDWEYDCRIASLGVNLHYVTDFVSEERDHDGDRLSGGGNHRLKLKSRAAAHIMILKHAQRAGIRDTTLEMQHFARELFLLSRQCGAAGLTDESMMLFDAARRASGEPGRNAWDFRLYGALARLVGWTWLGRVACYSDAIRETSGRNSKSTEQTCFGEF